MYEQPYNPYRSNLAIVKDYFRQPAVLALAIVNIVSVIAGIIQTILSADFFNEIFPQISTYIDRNLILHGSKTDASNEALKGLRDALANPGSTTTISIPIFAVLTIVALLLIYFSSRSDKPDASSFGAGFTILNVIAIISLVGSILAVVAMAAIPVILFVEYAIYKATPSRAFTVRLGASKVRVDASFLLVLAIVVTVIVVILSFFLLFSAISRKQYIGSVKRSINSVELSRKGAKAFGVFCILTAITTGASLLSSIALLALKEPIQELYKYLQITVYNDTTAMKIFFVVSSATSFVIAILQAKIAFGYANYIDAKKSGFVNPPVEAPAPFYPMNVGVGSHAQPTPYTYLAQPNAEKSAEKVSETAAEQPAESFDNPYAESEEKPAAPAVCPSCGAPVEGSSAFCGNCGAKL